MAVNSGTSSNVLERSVIASHRIRVRIVSYGSLWHRQMISTLWMSLGKNKFLDEDRKGRTFPGGKLKSPRLSFEISEGFWIQY
jgi:hypothetical protein